MLARRLSLVLSILALGLMVLACSLSYRSTGGEAPSEAIQATPVGGARAARCEKLNKQLHVCASELKRVYTPLVPEHYPTKIRRLIAVKKGYQVENGITRGCQDDPVAPGSKTALDRCLTRTTCDDFARCVSDNADDF